MQKKCGGEELPSASMKISQSMLKTQSRWGRVKETGMAAICNFLYYSIGQTTHPALHKLVLCNNNNKKKRSADFTEKKGQPVKEGLFYGNSIY